MVAAIAENHCMGMLKRLKTVVFPGDNRDNFSHTLNVTHALKSADQRPQSVPSPHTERAPEGDLAPKKRSSETIVILFWSKDRLDGRHHRRKSFHGRPETFINSSFPG